MSTEGVSKGAYTTQASRGTPCYRAPELVKGSKPSFSNRVDVWGMGCILFQLALRKKAFQSDWAVGCYSGSKTELNVAEYLKEDSVLGDISRKHLVECVYCMLDIDPVKRPSAKCLQAIFMRILVPMCSNLPHDMGRVLFVDLDDSTLSSTFASLSLVWGHQELI